MSEIRKLGANDLELAAGGTGVVEQTTSPGNKLVTKLDATHINLRSISGSVESNITSLDSRVDTLETTSATHTTDIDAAEVRLDTAEAELNTITAGQYTPTGTASTYVSSITEATTNYFRVGNMVMVNGSLNVTTTGGSTSTPIVLAELFLSLPIATTFSSTETFTGLVGTGTTQIITGGSNYVDPVYIYALTTSEIARIKFVSRAAASHLMFFSFMYKIA